MSGCPKCNGSMSEGFIVDQGSYGTAAVSTFQSGKPEVSYWVGLKQDKKGQIPVTTMRCNRCGFLENYAKA